MINMNETALIIDQLKKDQIKNLSLLYFLQNNPVHYVKKIGDAIFLKGRSDQDWIYISCYTPSELGNDHRQSGQE